MGKDAVKFVNRLGDIAAESVQPHPAGGVNDLVDTAGYINLLHTYIFSSRTAYAD